MIKRFIIASSIATSLFALTASEYKAQQMQNFKTQQSEFNKYKSNVQKEFQDYKTAQEKAFNDYKKEVGAFWEEPKLSTKKTWVAYTKDKKTRTNVDFENETIVVQTIAKSPKEAKKKLRIALAKVVTVNTKTVQKNDPLEVKLAKVPKPFNVVDKPVKAEPILSTVVFKKPPTKEKIIKYVKSKVQDKKIKSVKSTKIEHARVYSVVVKLPKNAMVKRSKLYLKEVKKQAKRQDLPVPLIFAIMHSESSFNPRARSNIPAYGLMQIVPRTAGIDTYRYLYKKKKLVSGSYLYDSTNNITMGSAYLHILYYRYLRKIKDPDSRLYCTIAAYNTGAGNIAWAFTRSYNMNKAAPIINKLTPDEVYAKLLKDLKYDEPKHYLKKVSRRMSSYHKVYGL